MSVVVGIFADHAAVGKLVDSLKSGGFDPTSVTVISNQDAADSLVSSGIEFVLSGEAEESAIAGGRGIITSHGGTAVPGLDEVDTDVAAFEESPALEALSDLDVPDSRIDDYLEAIDRGRCVAGISTSDADKAKALFAAAGGNPVEVF